MTNDLATQQKGMMTLRDLLEVPERKSQMERALPKWLTVDRLYRVIYSSAMKNPKIALCSPESILATVMQCAQLGLEPILGRAYLIPYENKRQIGGQWVKVPELQMQVGYQGLVDLARRSDTISDVWGANVYEADEFDLTYGTERNLHHRPWHLDPAKRKNGNGGGEILGAYVVWKLKDGTKHPDYMPIFDIHRRRALSQSYKWAETGDPKRGGGKKDSIWHLWPDEQNLKTVLKHSSKLIPASIEFMQAIELDNDQDYGAEKFGFFSDSGGPARITYDPDQQPKDLAERFREAMGEFGKDPKIDDFVRATAKGNGVLVGDIMQSAIADRSNFTDAFIKWRSKLPDAGAETPPGEKIEGTESQQVGDVSASDFVNEWLRLHGANFEKYVNDNLDRFAQYPPWVLKKAQDKFANKVGKPWPSKNDSGEEGQRGVGGSDPGEGNDSGKGSSVQSGANQGDSEGVDFESNDWQELMMLKDRYPDIFKRDVGDTPLDSMRAVRLALQVMNGSVK